MVASGRHALRGRHRLPSDAGGGSREQARGGVDRLEQNYAQLANDTDELQAALQNAANSTYLVIYQKDDGSELGFGTPWAVAPSTLATNAHVARSSMKSVVEPPCSSARPAATLPDPVDIPVRGIELHPGYGEFAELWKGYVPVRFNAVKDMERVRSAGSGVTSHC